LYSFGRVIVYLHIDHLNNPALEALQWRCRLPVIVDLLYTLLSCSGAFLVVTVLFFMIPNSEANLHDIREA
jgi:hypothetical protein